MLNPNRSRLYLSERVDVREHVLDALRAAQHQQRLSRALVGRQKERHLLGPHTVWVRAKAKVRVRVRARVRVTKQP